MTSSITQGFRKLFAQLPDTVQQQAQQAYALWQTDPYHNSLQFKRVSPRQPIYAVRIGRGHRALGLRTEDHIDWFWVGSHAEYDNLLKRL